MRLAMVAVIAGACGRLGFDDVLPQDTGMAALPAQVQSGAVGLAVGEDSRSVTISAVDPTRSVLAFSVAVSGTVPSDLKVAGELQDATTLVFRRLGSAVPAALAWQVVSWDGWRVQRGTASLSNNVTEAYGAVSPVDVDRSFVITTSIGDGLRFNDDDCVRAELASPTQARFVLGNPGTNQLDVYWQVVEVPDARVQHGLADLLDGVGSIDAAVAPVALEHAWLVYSYSTNNLDPAAAASMQVRGTIADAQTVRFDRAQPDGDHRIAWQLVELAGAFVQHGDEPFAAGETMRQATLGQPIAPESAFALGGAWGGSGGSSARTADANPGGAWATMTLIGNGTIELARAATAEPAAIPWSVVELR